MTDKPKSNRRDFLKGKAAVDAIQDKTQRIVDENPIVSPLSDQRMSSYLEQYVKNAMACEFELSFNLHQYPQAGAAAMAAFQLIDQLEDQMTVYREHSEISQLNASAFNRSIPVEPKLFGLLETAQNIFELTGKAFDITASSLSKLWGFDQRNGAIPSAEAIAQTLEQVGSNKVVLNRDQQTVQFTRNGVSIDLGGIGKGYALDQVVKRFNSQGIDDFLIHGGQSSVCAFGSSNVLIKNDVNSSEDTRNDSNSIVAAANALESAGWEIGVSHPTIPATRLGTVTLVDQALGTSGTARQGFYHQGKRYGHIIDPRTGWPTDHFLSTTVVSNSAAWSDALATAFYVMQIEEIESFCQEHPDIGAILVLPDKKAKNKIRVVTFNLDQRWNPES
jgi:thiamine biosynthesis lipoprotein